MFRAMMTEFQQGLGDTIRTTMETAVRTLVQAQQHAVPVLPREEQIFDDDYEEAVFENQFALLGEQHHRDVHRNRDMIVSPRVENQRWESGFKLDLHEFTGGQV